ncbi:MAG: hypothetical protein IJS13_06875 [Paludibacteraceae bacterium]|nr:hypothetical protein [Paludibacteraceae bacterium]
MPLVGGARRKSINDINSQLNRIVDTLGGIRLNDDFEWVANNPNNQQRWERAQRAAATYDRNIRNSPSGDRSIIASNNAFWSLDSNSEQRARDINERFKARKYSQRIYMGLANG